MRFTPPPVMLPAVDASSAINAHCRHDEGFAALASASLTSRLSSRISPNAGAELHELRRVFSARKSVPVF